MSTKGKRKFLVDASSDGAGVGGRTWVFATSHKGAVAAWKAANGRKKRPAKDAKRPTFAELIITDFKAAPGKRQQTFTLRASKPHASGASRPRNPLRARMSRRRL